MIDYYEILEVSPNASPEVIKGVYQIVLQRYDLEDSLNDPEKIRQLKAINLAYEVLSDPEKRMVYNLELNKAVNVMNEFQQKQKNVDMEAENTAKLSQVATIQVRNTGGKTADISESSSILSRIKWNRWGWIVSILAVVIVLVSMIRPDPDKALRGQLAVATEAERERKELEAELNKAAKEELKTDSVKNKEKMEKGR
jgi:hypothetical protein